MTERELFIDWMNSKYSDFNTFDIAFNESENCFNHMPTQARWEAWQAATQREGFRFVPVNPDNEVISSLAGVICDEFDTTIDGSEHCAKEVYKAMIGDIDE